MVYTCGLCLEFRPDDKEDNIAEPICRKGYDVNKESNNPLNCLFFKEKTWNDITSYAEIITCRRRLRLTNSHTSDKWYNPDKMRKYKLPKATGD